MVSTKEHLYFNQQGKKCSKAEIGLEFRETLADVDRKIELDGIECVPNIIDGLITASNTMLFKVGDIQTGLMYTRKSKDLLGEYLQGKLGMPIADIDEFCRENSTSFRELDQWWELLMNETTHLLESYIDVMEKNRPFDKKFYAPRARTLKTVVDDMQRFDDSDDMKFYGLSMPSRVGKSTIMIFFLTWVALKRPNSHNAMGGHSGTLVKGFYKELLNFITSEEYTFAKIYANAHPQRTCLRDKSAEDYTILLDRPDRFATLTCRGIDATWTGAVDVSKDGYLYVDDLVRDRQHSLSPQRMEETYQEYLNKMVDRKNDGAKEIMVGTLWNVLDPLERVRKENEGDYRYMFRRIPALNEKGESNFAYDRNGFSTEYYLDMKRRLDNAEWMAKFMQQPYVREGLLFATDELKYFDGLVIKSEIKRVFCVCDPAFGGGDNFAVPICYELINGRKLIVGWIYDKRTLKYTVPRLVSAMVLHTISEMRLEKNGAGLMLEKEVKNTMKDKNVNFCRVVPVSAPNRMSKEDKIKGYSDYIKDNFEFLVPNYDDKDLEYDEETTIYFKRDADYNNAMDDMSMYTAEGKNEHDDSADAMAQLSIMCEKGTNGKVEAVKNPFA